MKTTAVSASISDHHDGHACLWCRRDIEGVTVTFPGFLADAVLCFKCLAQAIRVRAQQASQKTS
jgi:hypothetical protein